MGENLDRILGPARAAWPELAVPAEAFAASVDRACAGGVEAEQLNLVDLYLACACALGQPAAIAVFEARYVQRVAAYLARQGGDAEAADEVRQAVRTHLLVAEAGRPPRIGEYSGRGSLASWVRVVAVRLHATLHRKAASDNTRREPGGEELAASPELAVLRARHLPAVASALRGAADILEPRERVILRMHFVNGLSMSRIGVIHGVHKATVSRWISAAREKLLASAGERLRAQTGAAPSELRSLLGLLGSELDVSISGLLGEPPPPAR